MVFIPFLGINIEVLRVERQLLFFLVFLNTNAECKDSKNNKKNNNLETRRIIMSLMNLSFYYLCHKEI